MTQHETTLLGAYVLGVLDDTELTRVDKHLESCGTCRTEIAELRDVEAMLGEVPAEALIEGPPADGDLLLQRTLREVRSQRTRHDRTRRATMIAAAAAVGAVVLGGGAVLGRRTAPEPAAAPPLATPAPSPSATVVPGTKTGRGVDATTGARMDVTVRPFAGWVRVNVSVAGIRAGQRCKLFVIAKNGTRVDAGSWVVSPAAEASGTTLDGFALVPPAAVASVLVENLAGEKLVSVPV